jgi:hypothetical protein
MGARMGVLWCMDDQTSMPQRCAWAVPQRKPQAWSTITLRSASAASVKSLLVLFFRKEHLPQLRCYFVEICHMRLCLSKGGTSGAG